MKGPYIEIRGTEDEVLFISPLDYGDNLIMAAALRAGKIERCRVCYDLDDDEVVFDETDVGPGSTLHLGLNIAHP